MSIFYKIDRNKIVVFGNTYPHKENIKSVGARFNGADKTWWLEYSAEAEKKIDEICVAAGGNKIEKTIEPKKPIAPKPLQIIDPLASSTDESAQISAPKVEGLTVSKLMNKLSLAVSHAFPATVWVIGEIQNLSIKDSGIFLELSEKKSEHRSSNTITVRCTLWNSTLTQIKEQQKNLDPSEIISDGIKVRVLCSVNFYKERGSISLNIQDIDPNFTKGALALEREKNLKELIKKGLDKKNKALSLTRFPLNIGLISADGSRAKSDFLDQLVTGKYPGSVKYINAQMQGEKTAKDIVKAIEKLNQSRVDLIVITRGGGSAADLRWFDQMDIALAIAHSQVPVLSAIGHHDDICIAEIISFHKEKTPTAAAEFVLKTLQNTNERISLLSRELAKLLEIKAQRVADNLNLISSRLYQVSQSYLSSKDGQTNQYMNKLEVLSHKKLSNIIAMLDGLAVKIDRSAISFIQMLLENIAKVEKSIVQLDPTPWLSKGWTQLFKGSKQIKSVDDVNENDKITARVIDGIIDLKVISTTKDGDKNG